MGCLVLSIIGMAIFIAFIIVNDRVENRFGREMQEYLQNFDENVINDLYHLSQNLIKQDGRSRKKEEDLYITGRFIVFGKEDTFRGKDKNGKKIIFKTPVEWGTAKNTQEIDTVVFSLESKEKIREYIIQKYGVFAGKDSDKEIVGGYQCDKVIYLIDAKRKTLIGSYRAMGMPPPSSISIKHRGEVTSLNNNVESDERGAWCKWPKWGLGTWLKSLPVKS